MVLPEGLGCVLAGEALEDLGAAWVLVEELCEEGSGQRAVIRRGRGGGMEEKTLGCDRVWEELRRCLGGDLAYL